MKYLSNFNHFLNELINSPMELNNNQIFQKGEPIDVALLTFKEYYKLVNPSYKHHENNWNYDLKKMNEFPQNMNKLKLFQRKKVGNLEILFYESREKLAYGKRDEQGVHHTLTDEEVKKSGLPEYEISLYAFHDGNKIGYIVDEWGATLVAIAKEYRGNNIGKMLTYYFRKKHPDRESGGFSNSGATNLKNVYREFVKEYLRNGVYSYLVKNGKLTAQRAKEIIKSADLENNRKDVVSDFAKNYNTKDLNENLLFWRYSENDFILFDRTILTYFREPDNNIIEHFLKAHIYLMYNENLKSYELYNSYGISEKFEAILLNVACETIKLDFNEGITVRVVNDLSEQTLKIVDKFKNSDVYNSSTKKEHLYIEAKEGVDYSTLFNKAKVFFKQHDKYNELEDFVAELAYKMST